MKFVEGTESFTGKEAVHDRDEVLERFKKAAEAAERPMIFLGAGVNASEMRESLRLANKSGADWNGVLCGRVTWQEGIAEHDKKGVEGLRDWLAEGGVENITKVNEIIDSEAQLWHEAYGGREKIDVDE